MLRSALIPLTLCLLGCDRVTTVSQVGAPIDASLEAFEGDWVLERSWDGVPSSEEVWTITATGERPGELTLRWAADDGREGEGRVQVGRTGAAIYVSGSIPEGPHSGKFLWGRVVASENVLVIYPPDPKEAAKLLEAGVLSGETERGHVHLDEFDDEKLIRISTPDHRDLFLIERPIIIRRTPPRTKG